MRELKEEAGLDIEIKNLIDAWVYHITEGVDVLILTYHCFIKTLPRDTKSPEGSELQWFNFSEIEHLKMPAGYKRSIQLYETLLKERG